MAARGASRSGETTTACFLDLVGFTKRTPHGVHARRRKRKIDLKSFSDYVRFTARTEGPHGGMRTCGDANGVDFTTTHKKVRQWPF